MWVVILSHISSPKCKRQAALIKDVRRMTEFGNAISWFGKEVRK